MLGMDGTVKACGNNVVGQLGTKKQSNSNILFKASTVSLADLQVKQVSAGDTHTLFLTLGG